MNLLVLVIVPIVLFSDGGLYIGGPAVGGGSLGLVLLICLIVYLVAASAAEPELINRGMDDWSRVTSTGCSIGLVCIASHSAKPTEPGLIGLGLAVQPGSPALGLRASDLNRDQLHRHEMLPTVV